VKEKKLNDVSAQCTRRLEDIKRSELGYLPVIEVEELPDRFCRRMNFHNDRGKLANRGIDDQPAIGIAERQLTVLLVIIIDHISIKIMQLDK